MIDEKSCDDLAEKINEVGLLSRFFCVMATYGDKTTTKKIEFEERSCIENIGFVTRLFTLFSH